MESKEERLVQGWIRPLSMPSIQILPSERPVDKIDPARLVQDLCRDNSPDVLEKVKKRYLRLSTQDLDIFIVPAENVILDKIVWPLITAKQAFCLTNFIGCIALCGMVCEMAIVFIYDLGASLWDISCLDHQYQHIFIDRKFERLGQKRRINELLKLGAISDKFAKDAHTVREIRRGYLHFLSKDYSKSEKDAYEVYTAAFRVIKPLVALPLGKKGKLVVPSHLKTYLESKAVTSSSGS